MLEETEEEMYEAFHKDLRKVIAFSFSKIFYITPVQYSVSLPL